MVRKFYTYQFNKIKFDKNFTDKIDEEITKRKSMNMFDITRNDSPIILHAAHGGTMIPESELPLFNINGFRLNEEVLHMTDWFTDVLVEESNKKSNTFINRMSRLVCDPERFPDDSEIMNNVGMGFAYTHGHDRAEIRSVTESEKFRIKESYFDPYSEAMQLLTDETWNRHGMAYIIDLHSYAKHPLPYEGTKRKSRPEICIGFDEQHSSPELISIITGIFERSYETEFNTPFAGSYVPLGHYGKTPSVQSVMLEIRRDIYMNEDTGEIRISDFRKLSSMISELQSKILEFS